MNGEMPSNINIMAIAGFIAKKIYKPKSNKKDAYAKSFEEIIAYLGMEYFQEELKIPATQTDAFLAYVKFKNEGFQQLNYLDIIFILNKESVEFRQNKPLKLR